MSRRKKEGLASWFRGLGAYVAMVFWLCLAYMGGMDASRPEAVPHQHVNGWALLLLLGAVAVASARHWIKYVHFVFGAGVLGCLLATGSGHLANGRPIGRPFAAAATILFYGCFVASLRLAERPLTIFDRVALMAFLAALVGGMVTEVPAFGLVGFGVGCLLLWAAVLRGRLGQSERRKRTMRQKEAAGG